MNRINETMLTSPNLSYTSRDYNSIYSELINSIPLLTKEWEAKDENDPGVVLIKLISMLGDMLSYNQDKQALEAFPKTVLQRANAQQIFRLIGYKMHWWRSAKVDASFTNANTFPVYISKYNTFTTSDSNIVYTNLNDIIIPVGAYGVDSYKTELIQGTPITPTFINTSTSNMYNSEWHESYDYNVSSVNVVNNKLYLKYKNIDETSIALVDNDETPFASNEWKLVNNINLSESMEKVFEFDVDEDGIPFILLPDYWNTKFVITKFKLFFIVSDGKNGEIEENKLTTINPKKVYANQEGIDSSSILQQVTIYNSTSTYGYNPETCVEARKESEKYQNTIDTLVILKDFEKAIRRIDSVANVIATDIQTDPYKDEMSEYQINLWIVRKNDYNNQGSSYIYTPVSETVNTDEIFKENIIGELSSYKLMPYDININLERKVNWIDWTVGGQIFLRNPINIDQNHDLMVKINNNLKNRFNVETLDFNEAVNYMDVIECIMKTDKNIWHVDLDSAAIEYTKVKRLLNGNDTGFYIQTKYMIYTSSGEYTGYYLNSFGCTSIYINKILPYITYTNENGDVVIKDEYKSIYDNSSTGFLAGTDSYDVSKSIEILNENSVSPGGSGNASGAGNRIIREDGVEKVIGLDFGNPTEPREYEVYNNVIVDWTDYEPKNTGYFIDTSTTPFSIKTYDTFGNVIDTPYSIICDSRMYDKNGNDVHRYFVNNTRKLSPIFEDERKVYDIYESIYNEWIGESVDILTGEIFIQRGNYWYTTNRAYNQETGSIVDTFGDIQYEENMSIVREPAAREDITGEYIQTYEVKNGQNTFDFYLGQSSSGEPLRDSIGNIIKAYPIKPYSLFIYINGDEEIIADNGSGNLNSTPGLLDGYGTIDYSTGKVSFKTTIIPSSIKIMYTVNKMTYSNYITFDSSKLFVRPEYIRSNLRK